MSPLKIILPLLKILKKYNLSKLIMSFLLDKVPHLGINTRVLYFINKGYLNDF